MANHHRRRVRALRKQMREQHERDTPPTPTRLITVTRKRKVQRIVSVGYVRPVKNDQA
jgi:hypothetical protein